MKKNTIVLSLKTIEIYCPKNIYYDINFERPLLGYGTIDRLWPKFSKLQYLSPVPYRTITTSELSSIIHTPTEDII